MNDKEIEDFYNKKLRPIAKGSQELAYAQFRYFVLVEDVDPNLIHSKLTEYNNMCLKEQTESKYIKHTHNWLKEKGFLDSYISKDSKTREYLSRWLHGLKYLFA